MALTANTDPTVAATIYQQIGRLNLLALRARGFVFDSASVSFAVGDPRRGVRVLVALTAADLYDVKAVRVDRRTFEVRTLSECHGVAAEQLADAVFEVVDGEL